MCECAYSRVICERLASAVKLLVSGTVADWLKENKTAGENQMAWAYRVLVPSGLIN